MSTLPRPPKDIFRRIRSAVRIRTRLRPLAYLISPPKPKPLILAYHRIADEPVDPWGIAVSPSHFEEQLCVLRRTRYTLPLAKFVSHLVGGTLPANAVALTFDDGYVDNLIAGKPRLAAADVPATVFLTTGYLNSSRKFWFDELAKLLLCGDGPKNFEFLVRGQNIRCDIGADPPAIQKAGRPAIFPKSRYLALMKTWEILRRLDESERESVMHVLGSIFAVADHQSQLARVMTNEEVRALVADGLVTIGAHTVSHPMLSVLEAAACCREITDSKLACESLINAPVASFAYPYGDFDASVREEVAKAGFAIACSVQRGPVSARSDRLALPRNYISNLNGDEFERFLRVAADTH